MITIPPSGLTVLQYLHSKWLVDIGLSNSVQYGEGPSPNILYFENFLEFSLASLVGTATFLPGQGGLGWLELAGAACNYSHLTGLWLERRSAPGCSTPASQGLLSCLHQRCTELESHTQPSVRYTQFLLHGSSAKIPQSMQTCG